MTASALVQSSSTVTSVIVGLVAGGVPVVIAVPMIMGANWLACRHIASMRSSHGRRYRGSRFRPWWNAAAL